MGLELAAYFNIGAAFRCSYRENLVFLTGNPRPRREGSFLLPSVGGGVRRGKCRTERPGTLSTRHFTLRSGGLGSGTCTPTTGGSAKVPRASQWGWERGLRHPLRNPLRDSARVEHSNAAHDDGGDLERAVGIWSVRNLPSGSRSRGCQPSRWGLIGPSTMALAVGLVVGLDRSSVSGYWDLTRETFVVAVLLTLGFFPARPADRTTQAPGRRAVPGSACRGELARTSATAGVHLILSAGRVVVVFAAAMTSIVDTRGAGVCPPSADMDFPYKLPGFSSQKRSHALSMLESD